MDHDYAYENSEGKTVQVKAYLPVNTAETAGQGDDTLKTPITVENVPKGRFWIEKQGTWNNGTPDGITEALDGVTFKVYKKSSADSTFEADSKGNPVATLTTGTDGKVQSGWLDAGEYWVIETGVSKRR